MLTQYCFPYQLYQPVSNRLYFSQSHSLYFFLLFAHLWWFGGGVDSAGATYAPHTTVGALKLGGWGFWVRVFDWFFEVGVFSLWVLGPV